MARRLVESGVRFVTVTYGGWDMHTGIAGAMRRDMPSLDQALAALIEDLESRGLLSKTLVMVSSECFSARSMLDLFATIATSPQTNVSGPLKQRTQLVRGQNNVDVWGRFEDKLAVAVVEPAPFDIEVVQPQVPVVRFSLS